MNVQVGGDPAATTFRKDKFKKVSQNNMRLVDLCASAFREIPSVDTGQAEIFELERRVRDSMMGRVVTGDWVHGFVFVWAREASRPVSVSSECR